MAEFKQDSMGTRIGFRGIGTGFYQLPGFEKDIAGLMAAWPPLPHLRFVELCIDRRLLFELIETVRK